MTTVETFIEYLQKLPPKTEITVLKVYDCGYVTCVEEVPLDLDETMGNADFTDLTGNPDVDETVPDYNPMSLLLGEK